MTSLTSCSFDKQGLILITFDKQHQHTFRNVMPFKFLCPSGAGAIELAEWRGHVLPKFLTAGARGHNRIYGAPVKRNKKINEKAKYSAKEVFSVSSLGNGHTHQQLCRSHCVLCRRRQQTPLQFVDINQSINK